MTNKSNVDVAFDIVSANSSPISFKDLWDKICQEQEIAIDVAAKRIGDFYTSLLLDGRFINLGDNTWDLRSRYTFEKATLDTNQCYSDLDDEEEVEIDPEDSERDPEEDDEESDEDGEEKSEFEEE